MKRSKQTSERKQVIVFIVCGCKKPSFQTDDIHTFWNGARCDFVKKTDQRHFEGLMIKTNLTRHVKIYFDTLLWERSENLYF